jgi:hypothetical protein
MHEFDAFLKIEGRYLLNTDRNVEVGLVLASAQYNKRLQQSWLSSRFLLSQEHAPMPRYRSAARQLDRTLCC